jgi:hypothetical protein
MGERASPAAGGIVLGLGLACACGGRTELLFPNAGESKPSSSAMRMPDSGGTSDASTADSGGGPTCSPLVPLQCPAETNPTHSPPPTQTCVGPEWAEWPMPDPEPAHIPAGNYSVDTADGVVTDTVTGLVWQEPIPNETYTWEEARCYCAALALTGHRDWRLPSRIELISLIDETITPPGPNINSAVFPSTVGGERDWDATGYGYWTSTPKAGDASAAWKVHFDNNYGNYIYEDVTLAEHVRCVRWPEQGQLGAARGHWTIQNGAVHDNFTTLTWQQSIATAGGDDGLGGYSWGSHADSYCGEQTLQGGGWRVPKVKELTTIVDVTTMDPAIDATAFPGAPIALFWSSTQVEAFSTAGLFVDFDYGGIGDDGVQYPYPVRCVR